MRTRSGWRKPTAGGDLLNARKCVVEPRDQRGTQTEITPCSRNDQHVWINEAGQDGAVDRTEGNGAFVDSDNYELHGARAPVSRSLFRQGDLVLWLSASKPSANAPADPPGLSRD
jgi:hypothetical protein